MKKTLTIFTLALGLTSTFAQTELKSKKEEVILPEAGDWAIGIDANPFLNYIGNMFGKTAANVAPSWNFHNANQIITGKYYSDASTAFRASLRLGMNSATIREMEANRMKTALSPTANGFPGAASMVENTWKHSTSAIGLSGGIEKRKGKTRLQGYYGGELGIFLSTSKDKYTYGNKLAVNLAPSGSNQDQNVNVDASDEVGASGNVVPGGPIFLGTVIGGDARVTERKNGSIFSFGIRGFIGAEYFILPKLSLGGEFGWGIGLSTVGKSKTTYEAAGNSGGAQDAIGATTIEGSKGGGFSLDTDNNNTMWAPSGSLRINLHF